MLINLKVKTLDAQTHEFSIDNEITVREFKDMVAEKTNIAADQQRIIYCGRVMVDDKQLKEYADLDGKVVHVAERPPPSQRLPATDASTSVANTTNERRTRSRVVAGGLRNSPLFRALDGMVVGTMAFPVNSNTDNQTPANPFAASSSFCMNRITVARHMLECANNIAAYLEDPSRGLNNQALDILARGRWTMESTVVEVGITSDSPQSQDLVEFVQDAVQAAFGASGNTMVNLVQLPTVFSSNENDANSSAASAADTSSNEPIITENEDETPTDAGATTSAAAASVVIDDVEDDEDTPTNAQSNNNSATTSPTFAGNTIANDDNETATASGSNDEGAQNSRTRTSTTVLAHVIEQLRNVQNRLNPFIQQYYDLLEDDRSFDADDTTGRENAQRLFDRVSEAFHYMSHAQHAISDLMLDVTQESPRYLTCRPILVEQSGYVSSNNFLTPAFIPAMRPPPSRSQSNANVTNNASNFAAQLVAAAARTAVTSIATNTNSNATATAARSSSNSGSSSSSTSNANNSTVDDPIDAPVVWESSVNMDSPPETNNNANTTDSNISASARTNPARVTTATLPTTSTQTRSTSRPQVHIGNIPVLGMPTGWNGRVIPNNNVSSFDRFLPCNSHHIREPAETSNNANTDNGSTNATAAANASSRAANRNSSSAGARAVNANSPSLNPTPVLNLADVTERNSRGISNRSSTSTETSTSNNTSSINISRNTAASENRNRNTTVGSTLLNTAQLNRPQPPIFDFSESREFYRRGRSRPQSSAESTMSSERNQQDTQRLNIHTQLMNCLNNQIFEGQPINDDTIPPAINRALQWFGESLLFLPQYEKPEYDSRDSLCNILKSTLPTVIELLKRNPVNLKEFEQRLKQICEQFRKRLYSVLYICIGRANAEIFWVQLMRLLGNSIQTNLHGDVVEFLALFLTPTIPSATDEADAQQFIVLRNSPNSNTNSMEMPIDTDVEMPETAGTTSQPEIDDEPLPPVVSGSENWHRHFPNDWLPIIARDIQRQTDNPQNQSPFSDAYISGMSSKRRKLVQNSKPPTEIGALIADSVKKAIQNPGHGTTSAATSATPPHTPEEVARAIASDTAVQTACIEAVRTNVRERLKKDPDFEAEKFPKSNKFIKK